MLRAVAPFASVLAAVLLFQIGYGLLGSLLPVRLGQMGQGAEVAGLVSAGYYGGLLVGILIGQRVLPRVGHIRAFAAFASAGTAVALVLALTGSPLAWVLLRFVGGLSVAGLFLIAESWLNMASDNANRGAAFSAYTVVTYAGVGMGQILLGVSDPAGFQLFNLAALAIVLAIMPMTLTRRAQPVIPRPSRLRLVDLFRVSPVGMVGSVTSGVVTAAVYGLLPFWGERQGLGISEIAAMMTAAVVGGLLFALPLGRLSDRIDRRIVIVIACCGGIAASGALLLVGVPGVIVLAILVLLFGGMTFPLYSIAVAHTNDYLGPEDAVAAGAGLLIAYSLGAVGGPLIASLVMRAFGHETFFAFTAVTMIALAILAILRIRKHPAPAPDDKTTFVQLSETSAVAYELDPWSAGGEGGQATASTDGVPGDEARSAT